MDKIVKAIVQSSKKGFLIVREKGHEKYSFLGGGIEEGEGERQALGRESLEEIGVGGIKILARHPGLLHLNGERRHTVAVYYCALPRGCHPGPLSEIEEIEWVKVFNMHKMSTTSREIIRALSLPSY